MPKLTDAERERRRIKVQEEALELVAARGQFNFRLDGKDIKRLYKLAGKQQRPVSALVREWVLERLEKEESSKYSVPLWAQELEARLTHTELLMLMTLSNSKAASKQQDAVIKSKLREYICRHYDVDKDKELYKILWT